jgi:hypothetical protein
MTWAVIRFPNLVADKTLVLATSWMPSSVAEATAGLAHVCVKDKMH